MADRVEEPDLEGLVQMLRPVVNHDWHRYQLRLPIAEFLYRLLEVNTRDDLLLRVTAADRLVALEAENARLRALLS